MLVETEFAGRCLVNFKHLAIASIQVLQFFPFDKKVIFMKHLYLPIFSQCSTSIPLESIRELEVF